MRQFRKELLAEPNRHLENLLLLGASLAFIVLVILLLPPGETLEGQSFRVGYLLMGGGVLLKAVAELLPKPSVYLAACLRIGAYVGGLFALIIAILLWFGIYL